MSMGEWECGPWRIVSTQHPKRLKGFIHLEISSDAVYKKEKGCLDGGVWMS